MTISAANFRAVAPATLRPFLRVDAAEMGDDFAPVVDAFQVACQRIEPVIRTASFWNILFQKNPFRLAIGAGELCFQAGADAVNTYLETFISSTA
jgi:hypothetical protein